MLDEMITVLKNFRDKIYQFFPSRRDAGMELVDALSSNTGAKSVVELSLNLLHRRNYCSITRVLDEFYPKDTDKMVKSNELTKILSAHCIQEERRPYYLFGVDCTPNPRRYSPTQEDRGFVYAPNTIARNKPVTIGHQYSIAAYLPEKTAENVSPWIMPLACHRVSTNEKGTIIGMQQINQCIRSQDTFKDKLCVSVGDSAYSSSDALFEAHRNPNQVHISRARSNRVFYYPINSSNTTKRGRNKCFGERFCLNDETTWKEPDEKLEFEITSKKGKPLTVKIACWNSIIMRGTQKSNVSEYPFRLVKICVYKESVELLFRKPLWLIVAGERRFELSLQNIFDCYRQRFDLEHFFRFGKNKLLMDKSQTPDVNHEQAWWQLTMIAYMQLYLARPLAENKPSPWEKYLSTFKSDGEISPTQVQKDFSRIVRIMGTPAKPPKRPKKAPGRQKGELQIKRKRHPIIIKKKIALPIAVSP